MFDYMYLYKIYKYLISHLRVSEHVEYETSQTERNLFYSVDLSPRFKKKTRRNTTQV